MTLRESVGEPLEDGSEGGAAGRRLRVLVVDDDRDTVLTLGILLRSEGADVRMLRDATKAVAAVRISRPDVVVLDISMPGRSGYSVAQELRGRLDASCPVLIALTAHGAAEHREQAFQCGFDHHVAKPYNPLELLQLIMAAEPRAAAALDPDATIPSNLAA